MTHTAVPTLLRWLAAPVVAAVFVAGVWVTGGVITDNFKAAMALTAAWFALAGAACVVIALRQRSVRLPVLTGFGATAAAVGAFLAWTTLRDQVVHEQVVVGAPASALGAAAADGTRNVELARGSFESIEHGSHGNAAIVRLPGGARRLTLTHFSTSPGPDLRVRLVPGGGSDGAVAGARDLGALKGNKGDQQYVLPASADLSRYRSVVIWCRAFSAAFARARLAPA